MSRESQMCESLQVTDLQPPHSPSVPDRPQAPPTPAATPVPRLLPVPPQ